MVLAGKNRIFIVAVCAFVAVNVGADGSVAAPRSGALPPEPSRQALVSGASIEQLTRAVARYRQIVAAGPWPTLPNRIILRAGDTGENVAKLRRRLEMSGDVRPASGDRYQFGSDLEHGVKRFQIRNGLKPTGIVYGITQRLLNIPAAVRLKQLELNLGRMRALHQELPTSGKYIVMNAAAFTLQGIRDGRVEVTSRTIAGKRTTPTPIVSARVRAVNLLPYWHVPTSIARAQIIPAARKNPGYLLKERIRVFSSFGGEEIDPVSVNWWGPEASRYVFRQDPGPQNALGVLRFDMPNKHTVYMHDTPMKQLFGSFERAYSSGCVRLQNYIGVADWLLDTHNEWNRATIQATISQGTPKTVPVSTPVPVFFIYLTAWVDQGVVNFRNDLYNLDDRAFDSGQHISTQRFPTHAAP